VKGRGQERRGEELEQTWNRPTTILQQTEQRRYLHSVAAIKQQHPSCLSLQGKRKHFKDFSYLQVLLIFLTDLRENFVAADFTGFDKK